METAARASSSSLRQAEATTDCASETHRLPPPNRRDRRACDGWQRAPATATSGRRAPETRRTRVAGGFPTYTRAWGTRGAAVAARAETRGTRVSEGMCTRTWPPGMRARRVSARTQGRGTRVPRGFQTVANAGGRAWTAGFGRTEIRGTYLAATAGGTPIHTGRPGCGCRRSRPRVADLTICLARSSWRHEIR